MTELTPRTWHPEDIKAAVRKTGTTLARLGRENKFGRSTLYEALTQRWPAAHLVIAQCLGVSRHELWPQWYGPDGEPLHRARNPRLARRIAASISRAKRAA